MKILSYLPLSCTLLLTACGGGGNDDSGDLIPPVVTPPPALSRCEQQSEFNNQTTASGLVFKLQSHYLAGQQSSVIATLGTLNSRNMLFQWQQLSGPSVDIAINDSPVLAFVPPQSGDYRFQLNVSGNDLSLQETVSLTVAVENGLNIRQDHQVVEGNNVSVRLDRVNGAAANNINWCIAAGPDLNLDLSNLERPLFVAPEVSQDTGVILRASANVNGEILSDEVSILITDEAQITSEYFDAPVARTHAYRRNSPYADVLKRCTYSNQLSACQLNTLPLIGQGAGGISDKEVIMDRVLVSHDWMGRNFEAFIEQMDTHGDFATLLQSVTAVVISYDIRPSFYWVVTGAIYLDPEDLWLTATERDSINEAPDYRAGFGNELQFLIPWRYVKDNDYASLYRERSQRSNRPISELTTDLSSLLYHELAHANDFFPRSVHSSLEGPTLLDDFYRRTTQKALISDQLSNAYPLNSTEMSALASVSFMGETATATQKAYSPGDVSSFFSADRANDFYNYSTSREDAAMLFEEAMMSYRLGVQRDVAVTDKPVTVTANSIIVDWGQRGRIGAIELRNRTSLVLNEMMPELNNQLLLDSLPAPLQMQPGLSWAANLGISATPMAPKSNIQHQQQSEQTQVPLRLSGDRHRTPVGINRP
ncbi:hypothetical protein C8J23_11992 [Shewanella chilikensis]|uniref:Lipoprotein n=1 Tax=Shewanella chilikensis TaxID=558541 RepID=A0ABX5PMF2_9GAMM|nr:hypothetical protein [Shewanella chilikensis]MCL1153026.1 hypothetical protein [Shewanella chilikensis]PYE57777.1 hypothetical protein C8J23_11992 [Shewanella chilikensis]GGZ34168.1 hypothetical protein GCM10007105_22050 [Shewanella chilikensis]